MFPPKICKLKLFTTQLRTLNIQYFSELKTGSSVTHVITLSLNQNDEVYTSLEGTTCSSAGANPRLYFQGRLIYPY